jgi:aminoglycoside 6'-N-acetyltransferase
VIAFRPLTDNDAGLLLLWMASPHVRQWWVNDGQTAEDAVEDALAYIGAANATAWIFSWNGIPSVMSATPIMNPAPPAMRSRPGAPS